MVSKLRIIWKQTVSGGGMAWRPGGSPPRRSRSPGAPPSAQLVDVMGRGCKGAGGDAISRSGDVRSWRKHTAGQGRRTTAAVGGATGFSTTPQDAADAAVVTSGVTTVADGRNTSANPPPSPSSPSRRSVFRGGGGGAATLLRTPPRVSQVLSSEAQAAAPQTFANDMTTLLRLQPRQCPEPEPEPREVQAQVRVRV